MEVKSSPNPPPVIDSAVESVKPRRFITLMIVATSELLGTLQYLFKVVVTSGDRYGDRRSHEGIARNMQPVR